MIDHIAINVKNIEESASWYQKNFGFSIQYIDDTWAMLELNGSKLALTIPDQHPNHIAISVNSLNDFPSNDFKYHRDGSAYLYQNDPDGNVIEYIYYPSEEKNEEWDDIHYP